MFAGIRKRSLLVLGAGLAAILALSACGSSSSSSSDSSTTSASTGDRVGYISVAPVTSGDWEQSNWHALQAAAAKYHLTVSNQESVSYDQAEQVLARMAPNEDVIIADSSGYEAPVLQVAERFPETMFIVFSDLASTNGLKNVAGWAANWNEMGYLAGTAGCLAAKSNGKSGVGHVNGEPIPAFSRFSGGVEDGATASGCKFQQTWINSFTDTSAAKQAAETMIGQGAGAITSSADTADQGSQAGAAANDTPFIADYAPTQGALTSVLINFDAAYAQIGQLWTSNQLKPKVYPMTVENGLLSYSTPFSGPAASVEAEALAIEQKIKSGQIKVDSTKALTP